MHVPDGWKYSEGHLWVRRGDGEDGEVVLGVTEFAVGELGEIVFVELPEAGRRVEKGEPLGSLESVKTVTELYCPVSGTVTRINGALTKEPGLLNESAYEHGWLAALRLDDPKQWDELLSADQYREMYGLDDG